MTGKNKKVNKSSKNIGPMVEVKLSGVALIEEEYISLLYRTEEDHLEFPGGRIEYRESRRATAVREASEETGYKVKLGKYFGPYIFKHNGKNKISHVYLAKIIGGKLSLEPKFKRLQKIRLKDYKKYKLAPNVKMFIENYLSS